ncbi:MAG: tyrosine recombinase XerC [Betaproteobacteria bacterium]|nr:tyrosine recombinase XerC [Betaproteobacteria bacterium]
METADAAESPPRADADRVDRFVAHLQAERRLSSHTVAAYRRDLGSLLRDAGGLPLTRITPPQLRRVLARQHASGLGGRSLARRLSAWRSFYCWLQRRGEIDSDPCAGIRAPKAPKRLPETLSPDVTAHLVGFDAESFDQRCERALFELIYSSGLRLSEAIGLDVGVIDLVQGTVRVLGKGAKTREVPVGATATATLREWLAVRSQHARADEPALFITRRGRRMGPRAVQTRLGRLAQARGLNQHVHPHMLRHAFASHLLQSSGDLRAVQELLGHASISTTQVYAHLDFQHLAKVYDAAHPRARKKASEAK